jgi:FkbM family methyltransferase
MHKEPGTISWIEEFAPGEVMIDIGANVGLYALCAARFRQTRVYGFEPESQNYALLNCNIYDNGLQSQVTAYCCALSDETRFDLLYLSQFMPGGSCHNFGESIGPDQRPMAAAFRQGCFSTTIDELVGQGVVPVPQHIKIDVDGIEHKVIRGASKTLQDPRLRSVLVEINTNLDAHWDVIDTMLDCGFAYSEEETERAQRKEGAFKNVGNYVFRR